MLTTMTLSGNPEDDLFANSKLYLSPYVTDVGLLLPTCGTAVCVGAVCLTHQCLREDSDSEDYDLILPSQIGRNYHYVKPYFNFDVTPDAGPCTRKERRRARPDAGRRAYGRR